MEAVHGTTRPRLRLALVLAERGPQAEELATDVDGHDSIELGGRAHRGAG